MCRLLECLVLRVQEMSNDFCFIKECLLWQVVNTASSYEKMPTIVGSALRCVGTMLKKYEMPTMVGISNTFFHC